MASGSSSDAAESAGSAGRAAAAPAAAETEEDRVKRRRLQCLGFALAGGCDTTMAPGVLSEEDLQTQVSSRLSLRPLSPEEAGRALQPCCAFAFQKALSSYFELPENDQGWPRQPPTPFKSEA